MYALATQHQFFFLASKHANLGKCEAKLHQQLIGLKADAECLVGRLPDVHASRRHVEVHNQKAQVLEVTMSQ